MAHKLWLLVMRAQAASHAVIYTAPEVQHYIGASSKAQLNRAIIELEEAGVIADEEV